MAFEEKIRLNLALAGYTPDQVEKLWSPINDGASFLAGTGATLSDDYFDFAAKIQNIAAVLNVTPAQIRKASLLAPTLIIRDARKLALNVQSLATLLPLDKQVYIERSLSNAPGNLVRDPESVARNIHAAADFLGLDVDDYLTRALKQPSLFTLHEERLQAHAARHSELLAIPLDDFKKAAIKEPSLLYKNPETTNDNVTAAASVLGLGKKRYVALLISQGQEQLMARSPDTLRQNIEGGNGKAGVADLLGVPREDFIKYAVKRATLFATSARRINYNAKKAADLMGADRNRYIWAALKRAPQLLTMRPATINANAEQVAGLLGIPKKDYVDAVAYIAPQILYQEPQGIHARMEQGAKFLGLDLGEYVTMALKQPSLFYRDPEVIGKNARLMEMFHDKGILHNEVREFYKKKPDVLCLAPENYHLRYLFARITGIKDTQSFGVLRRPRGEIERLMAGHFGHDPDQAVVTRPTVKGLDVSESDKKHRAFVGLIRRGVISTYRYEPETPTP